MSQFFKILLFLVVSLLTMCRQPGPPDFKLQKIIFHSVGEGCEGYCNNYHLEIDSNQIARLYAEKIYKPYDKIMQIFAAARQADVDTVYPDSLLLKEKMGYFTGRVEDSTFQKLKSSLRDNNLDSLEYKNVAGHDGIEKTLTILYNGKRKILQAMFPPSGMEPTYQCLYDIINQENFTRCNSFQVDK